MDAELPSDRANTWIAPIRRKSLDARLKQPEGKVHFLNGPEPEPKFQVWPAKALPLPQVQEEPDQTPFVFLDIETTGIGLSDQIVEIAIVDDNGETLISTRIRPTCRVHPKALAIHGLSNEALEKEPLFDEVEEQVIAAVKDKYVVMYSRDFDLRFLGHRVKQAIKGSFCCMREFARFHGEKRWNGDNQWKKLTEAAVITGYTWEGNPHGALPDALACRAVWNHINVKLSGSGKL